MPISQKNELTFIEPDWPAPANVKAVVTTRCGQLSEGVFSGFNVATHVGDDVTQVEKNRRHLTDVLSLPSEPFWLTQEHTTKAIHWQGEKYDKPPVADASWVTKAKLVSCVMTADCLPLLVTNREGSMVSSIHAGWKGLLDGVVSDTILALPSAPQDLMVWVGPAISQPYFEVGDEVRQAFIQKHSEHQHFFQNIAEKPGKFLANLPGLVDFELKMLGVGAIYHSGLCSYAQDDLFYSYRRDGQTGRMASMIWFT